jgi:hypothetical protein
MNALLIVHAAMAGVLLAVAFLVLYGGRRLGKGYQEPEQTPPKRWLRAVLLVPLKGEHKGMNRCLDTLLCQDYPNYEAIFITEDEEDPAAAVAIAAMARACAPNASAFNRPRSCQHIAAGLAETCGQKNYNLLAGIKRAAPDREVLVFCDSSHLAPPDWLSRLLAPIARGESVAATGYHHCRPAHHDLPILGRALSVLSLYMMQEIPAITQPWGGSMAITRQAFEELRVAEIWETNVVDDVSLAATLQRAGLKARAAYGASMDSPLSGETYTGWSDWLARQWLYLKFIFPGSWAAIGVALYAQAGLLLWAAGRCLAANLGYLPWRWSWDSAAPDFAYICGLALLGLIARTRHPDRIPPLSWLAAFFTTLLFAAYAHARTLFTMTMTWRGTAYRVGWGGKVKEIIRD